MSLVVQLLVVIVLDLHDRIAGQANPPVDLTFTGVMQRRVIRCLLNERPAPEAQHIHHGKCALQRHKAGLTLDQPDDAPQHG